MSPGTAPFYLAALVAALLAAAGPGPSAEREPSRWWQKVRADIEQFKRPIYDLGARTRPDDKPLYRKGRVFCPHEDRSPLRIHTFPLTQPGAADEMTLTVYWCEIEGIYWAHVMGGIAGYNLVTGPYRPGFAPAESRPATRPATRPAPEALRLHLERTDEDRPPAPGAHLRLALVLTNASDQPIWVNTNLTLATVHLEIRGPRVETEPLSSPALPRPLEREDLVRIEPKESHRITLNDLTDNRQRHHLALPGAYLIRATYGNEGDGAHLGLPVWTGTVSSNVLVVQAAGQGR